MEKIYDYFLIYPGEMEENFYNYFQIELDNNDKNNLELFEIFDSYDVKYTIITDEEGKDFIKVYSDNMLMLDKGHSFDDYSKFLKRLNELIKVSGKEVHYFKHDYINGVKVDYLIMTLLTFLSPNQDYCSELIELDSNKRIPHLEFYSYAWLIDDESDKRDKLERLADISKAIGFNDVIIQNSKYNYVNIKSLIPDKVRPNVFQTMLTDDWVKLLFMGYFSVNKPVERKLMRQYKEFLNELVERRQQ